MKTFCQEKDIFDQEGVSKASKKQQRQQSKSKAFIAGYYSAYIDGLKE
ncbi:hypothetical protein [Marinomonas algarum]|uniref:Uncharacterized protein n=1 Tax=Marinomonas algarum TaxID=2883105 RepID=A0A9X1LE75_9GAMM|nr:hypothetical protein [Marinomonas algarum]MCB5160901.1 hypothetical protein [Marinomonas algarum]